MMALKSHQKYKQQNKSISALEILTPRQTLKRLPIAFAQVNIDSSSECLLNETRETIYFLSSKTNC